MIFDEAIEKLLNNEDYNAYGLSVDDVINLIEVLRQEYAPTIEMTKEQYKAFVESVEGLATQKQLDSFVDEELDLGDMTVRRGLNAWLHPETIKVIGENNDTATSSRNKD
ncbi:hypothetical protein EFN72_07280 [Leuconostoc citreum]|uniref:hypothetical protein n=1 Tax=Leuconostoc citreum TaxID=33964 RepID=UPI0021A76217|nr:hypothetical protein [Leuconostoc citreum]MCT3059062.1 hypothetical protein [Leuconostoc citreum]